MENLTECEANYVPLTPITFLKRASECYRYKTSIIYGQTQFTWPQTYDRCCHLAASLLSLNIAKNDVVSILAPNTPAMYELHFAVPMARAILNPINIRLDANTIAIILRHAQPKILFIDHEYSLLARNALRLLPQSSHPLIIYIDDDEIDSTRKSCSKELKYDDLILKRELITPSSIARMFRVENEQDPISLNYTSGTTAEPKGVVISHRGAYLTALSAIIGWEMGNFPVYLWTLPMFHSNGWTHTWSVAARGGTNVCIRNVTAQEIYRNIDLHGVTHMACVPTVFIILLEGINRNEKSQRSGPVRVLTGGSAPPASLLKKVERLGFQVMHVYGLTEATGAALFCEWQDQWNRLPENEQMELKARQGVGISTLAEVDVKNTKTQESVPRDGKTRGEIVMRGNSIMKGYLKNPKATSEVFKNGWLNTGDIGVIHPDGYIEIKDRIKDIIISGGENISSIEVENVLYKHKEVLEVAVVAMPHLVWGEIPCAFVVLKKSDDQEVTTERDLIEHCRENLPHFMCPKKVLFLEELTKNGNGKILKPKLRDIAKDLSVREETVRFEKVLQRSEEKYQLDRVASRL